MGAFRPAPRGASLTAVNAEIRRRAMDCETHAGAELLPISVIGSARRSASIAVLITAVRSTGRWVSIGAATLALVAGLSACGTPGATGAAPASRPPVSAVAPSASAAAAADFDRLALDELDKIVNGADGVTADFDQTMKKRLP